jgi:twitching motility protein PilT
MTAINDAIPANDSPTTQPTAEPVPAAPVATPGPVAAGPTEPGEAIRAENGERITLKKLLAAMPVMQASDLHIKPLIPPTYRIGGHLRPVSAPPLTNEQSDAFVRPLMSDEQNERFERDGHIDFAWFLESGPHKGERFRCNFFKAGQHSGAAIRRVNAKIPDYESLNLPPIYSKIVENNSQGLVLVVGVTGSGKSSTLAAMVDHINHIRGVNIITIEDPVEYRFTQDKSIISQREIGIDVPDFPTALRSVVRQDPDVILIGEMRDHDTILAAIQAAETGHLVFGTLHTSTRWARSGACSSSSPRRSAPSSAARCRAASSRSARSGSIPAVEDFKAKIVPATEVLLNNATVRDKIREGEDGDLPAIINTSEGEGMHAFTRSFADLVKKEWVDLPTARLYAPNKEALDASVKGLEVKAQTLVSRIKGPR